MCGFCGLYHFDGAPAAKDLLAEMNRSIAHRGPDGSGLYLDREIGLGHRRLSIIDLEGGAQPLSNGDSSITVVFNGEIYNFIELREQLKSLGHRFRTESDTEVIVHGYEEWGFDCVSKFNGMFAFALWDSRNRKLFLARDHLGIKPLYYTKSTNRLAFASEVKALLKDPTTPRDVDRRALGELFTFRFVPAPNTLFRGIKKLPAGHYLVADRSGVKVVRYWNFVPRHSNDLSEDEIVEQYQALVQDAVRMQLRADVPVGLFLSSGVDSGCLLALMRKQSSGPIHTFTIGFEDGDRTNETDDARVVAERFGAEHHEMVIGAQDYLSYYERYLWDLEEPVGNESAAAFYFVSKLAASQVKVALTGQGADEPWGGYHRYLGALLSESYQRIPGLVRRRLISPLINALPRNERLKRGVASLGEPDTLTRFVKIYSFFTQEMRAHLFNDSCDTRYGYADYNAKEAIAHLQADVDHLDQVSQMLYIDTRASLPDDLLMVGDKTSMATSLEARVPFLDRKLIEFVENLPLRYKLRYGRGKYIHKKAIERWLPAAEVHRRKKGFSNPVEKWLRGRMADHVEECLFDPGSCIGEFFDVSYIRKLVELHLAGKENHMRHIYLLISFEMWHRTFMRAN